MNSARVLLIAETTRRACLRNREPAANITTCHVALLWSSGRIDGSSRDENSVQRAQQTAGASQDTPETGLDHSSTICMREAPIASYGHFCGAAGPRTTAVGYIRAAQTEPAVMRIQGDARAPAYAYRSGLCAGNRFISLARKRSRFRTLPFCASVSSWLMAVCPLMLARAVR